jgi:hypothetical protein
MFGVISCELDGVVNVTSLVMGVPGNVIMGRTPNNGDIGVPGFSFRKLFWLFMRMPLLVAVSARNGVNPVAVSIPVAVCCKSVADIKLDVDTDTSRICGVHSLNCLAGGF